jgi:Flp pilus assembly protein TadD
MDAIRKDRYRTILICAILGAVTLVTFWPLTSHEFINYDDSLYLLENTHLNTRLSWETLAWAFRTGYAANWHPLTWLSHALDVQWFGLKPGWHHLTGLLFHTGNATLLFLALKQLTGALWRSALVAALFAWHPLHVQSVAWAAERKDVLSGFFFMLTLLAYARYARCSSFTLHHSRWYFLSLFFFALGLMSKPMLVTLPFILLLLDYWPLQRLSLAPPSVLERNHGTRNTDNRSIHQSINPFIHHSTTPPLRLFLEKLPFLALSAVSSIITMRVQGGGGAVVPVAVIPLSERLSNAAVACASYLGKTFWPEGLAVFYPRWANLPASTVVLATLVILFLTAWAVLGGRRRPALTVGWFWFLGMLVPVSGLVQVGMQQMADRYTYLPLIGVFVMLAWGVQGPTPTVQSPKPELPAGVTPAELRVSGTEHGTRNAEHGSPFTFHVSRFTSHSPSLSTAAFALVLLICIALTRHELAYWHDSEALFGHALEVTGPNYIALNNYGLALCQHGKLDQAIGKFEAAVALDPSEETAYCGWGQVLMEQRKYDQAAEKFSRALQLKPGDTRARLQLGLACARQGKYDEAKAAFSEVLRLHPESIEAHNNLGNVLLLQGRHEEAAGHFAEAVRLKPDHASAHNNLAISCKKLGRTSEAIAHYREAIRLKPDFLEAINNLAWTLAASPDAQFRDGTEALRLATRLCELTQYQRPLPLATLAAAYAETGRFQEAVAFAEQAQKRAAGGQNALAEKLRIMLEAFRAGRRYQGD